MSAPTTPIASPAKQQRLLPTVVRESVGPITAGIVWILFVANFTLLRLSGGDAHVQYEWVQRLFGDRSRAIGYFFGLGLLEAPFYGAGKALEQIGVHTLGGNRIEVAAVALGTGLFVIPAGVIVVILLRALRLPAAGFVLLATAFGTPLMFWVVFSPGKNHPADAALFTLVVYLTYVYFRDAEPARWLPWALGSAFGLSIAVRYFAGAEAIALVASLAYYRRWRDAAEVALTTCGVFGLLSLIPLALDTPIFGGGYSASRQLGVYPLNPARMLFTDHRGLFVWTPVTVLALIGLATLLVRRRDQRRFLVAASAMGVAIILSYAFVPYWDGAWSFGQRYYTPLFPLVALGLAGLIDASHNALRAAVSAAIVLATAWSLFLCFNLVVVGEGVYTGLTVPDGAWGIALLPTRTHTPRGEYLWAIYYRSRLVKPLVAWPFSTGQPPR